MNRALGLMLSLAYLALSFATLAYWLPHFFAVNAQYVPETSYRYITATGLPFGLLLITAVARQSFKGFFSISIFLQVLSAAALLYAALYAFYYPQQANFFCAGHLLLCACGAGYNIHHYRKELRQHQEAMARA